MSFVFKIRCPHCGNTTARKFDDILIKEPRDNVMRCRNSNCHEPFEIKHNYYDGYETGVRRHPHLGHQKGPTAPSKTISKKLLNTLKELEAADPRPYPEKGEPIYVKRDGAFVEARR